MTLRSVCTLVLLTVTGIAYTTHIRVAQAATAKIDAKTFEEQVKPFLTQNCQRCHNVETSMAGVRVDQLDAGLDDRHIRLWEGIRNRVKGGTMPPKGQPQPTSEQRQQLITWINNSIEVAKLRPSPKNGLVRRLTVAQYRNTLRELLHLEDDLAVVLPPDALSKEGFLNNKETLQLSPIQLETYFEIAETALNRAIVDPKVKPAIQDFKVELGAGVNNAPLPEQLILGAGSLLLENKDFVVTQPKPTKTFPFEQHMMRTKYRYIEGYRGNDTVRGWRDYDSIYHAVFADVRGSNGYPKGSAYGTVPEGLLLRPAIPNDEIFGADGTYGPKANFKISVRELPDDGRFRVTVLAAKYNDGLLLDPGAKPKADGVAGAVSYREPKTPGTVNIPKAGIYQVDVHGAVPNAASADASKLKEGLSGPWPADSKVPARLDGKAKLSDSPLGKAVSLRASTDALVVARSVIPTHDSVNMGEGDFSVAAWIHPYNLRKSGVVSLGTADRTTGWYLETENRGMLRFQTAGPEAQSNATLSSQNGMVKANAWQHVAVVVRRGRNETLMYVNGYLVASSSMGAARFDATNSDLLIGNIPGASPFNGDIADVRVYNRPLGKAEIQALVQPGREFVKAPSGRKQELTLTLGDRQFTGTPQQTAFLAVRLDAGPLNIRAEHGGVADFDRIVLTPLAATDDLAKRFSDFEKRVPKLGVHLGLRRDCGSTFGQVGQTQTVAGTKLTKYVFEGAIRNFPSPEVEKDNVNYLAGVREIGVRSEYTDGRDMPRLLIRSVEFEGPLYETWPPQSHKNIFVEFDRRNDQPAYARKIVREFATKAYRRPITAGEEASLMNVYRKSSESGRSFTESIKDTLQVVLTSPQFLFLVENSKTPEAEPLDSYELASKLSYFLWNGPPDQTTLQLAASGTLRKQLDAEVARMVDNPKFSQFMREFAFQWLSLDKFQVLESDKKKYPRLTRDARAQLQREPIEFLQYLIRNNLPVKNLITSDFIMANETVANYYDLTGKTDSGFQFVPIKHERKELGGVLTQAAILAGLSDGRESNPVKRGAWMARKIIAEPPADPPPNVPALKEDNSEKLTLRQRIEQHRNQPGCKACHSTIDPWGVALEQYDAGGRFKTKPADARSTLPDKTEVNGIDDLRRYLSQDRIDQVAFSFLKHLATYGTGRTLTYSELHSLKQDGLKMKASGYRMKDMVRYVVNSPYFLEK